ncbi:hypothetical protein [Runella sp.]|jgi:hypothetical protein|nr:hypothetical protein [Runella sp.]
MSKQPDIDINGGAEYQKKGVVGKTPTTRKKVPDMANYLKSESN